MMERLFEQREVVVLEVGVDEELKRTRSQRAVGAFNGRGDEAPPESFGQCIGGYLAPVEPVGEVPQRSLTPTGLVDSYRSVRSRLHRDQIRAVAAPRHATLDFNSAGGEQF
jgi:hypothetical protein